jgi:hypothetical protein
MQAIEHKKVSMANDIDPNNQGNSHRHNKLFTIALPVAVFLVLFIGFGVVKACSLGLGPAVQPGGEEKAAIIATLQDSLDKHGEGKLTVTDVKVANLGYGNKYIAYLRINDTNITIAEIIPIDELRGNDNIFQYYDFKLDELELKLLQAYSEKTDIPAVHWSQSMPKEAEHTRWPGMEVWGVEQLTLERDGYIVYQFERKDDNTFRFLERWDANDDDSTGDYFVDPDTGIVYD